MHCVDLDESFPTSIYLQNVASIQPRTRPKKFESSSSRELNLNFKTSKLLFAAQAAVGAPDGAQATSVRAPDGAQATGVPAAVGAQAAVRWWLPIFWQISAKCCSFSAVSAPIFASKHLFAICSNLGDLPCT